MFSRPHLTSFCLLSSLLLSACQPAPSTPSASPLEQAVAVQLWTVTTPQAPQVREFPAVVEAAQVAQLAFRVGGELQEIPVTAGQQVTAGTLLARLDPTDYQLLLDQAEARFQLAQAQFERSRNLFAQQLLSAQQFDEIKANLEIARANRDTAQANIAYTELRAPFAGTVAHLFVENFETVQAQRPIATLQLSDAIDISIRVPENLFARVQRNLDYRPHVRFAALPEQHFEAQVKEWDSVADPATNTYRVVFTMASPPDINLLPGMSASVLVDTQAVANAGTDALIIPSSAVLLPSDQALDSHPVVWRFIADPQQPEYGTVQRQVVRLGEPSAAGIRIVEGLQAGDRIVRVGVQQLQDGQRVWAWQREPGL